MTAVNLLAVIDELRSGWYGETSRLHMPPEIRGAWMRLDIARENVAELIEAGQELLATEVGPAGDRLAAALARVRSS